MGPNASKCLPLTSTAPDFHTGIACHELLLYGSLQHSTTFHLPPAKTSLGFIFPWCKDPETAPTCPRFMALLSSTTTFPPFKMAFCDTTFEEPSFSWETPLW